MCNYAGFSKQLQNSSIIPYTHIPYPNPNPNPNLNPNPNPNPNSNPDPKTVGCRGYSRVMPSLQWLRRAFKYLFEHILLNSTLKIHCTQQILKNYFAWIQTTFSTIIVKNLTYNYKGQ